MTNNIFLDDCQREPDFINEEGTKWWIEKSLYRYAIIDKDLKGYIPYLVELKTGEKTRVLIDVNTNKVVYETTNLEAMACHIDMLSIIKRSDNE